MRQHLLRFCLALSQKHSTENSSNQNQDKIDCFFKAAGRRNTVVFQDRQRRKTAILLVFGEFGY
jgi:hypothetical protein